MVEADARDAAALLYSLAVEWNGAHLMSPAVSELQVRAWWTPKPEAEPEEWGATPEAQQALDEVKAALGAPTGVVRPRPGGLVAVRSAAEHQAPSAAEAPPS